MKDTMLKTEKSENVYFLYEGDINLLNTA